jgi:LmbE family N-acetylglucosaminyl deacetylase
LGGDRIREQQCAAKRLGIDLRIDRVAEENEFFNAPRGQMVAAIEKCFDSVRPDIFFIPSPSVNQDHVVAYDACLSAIRPPRDRNLSAVHVYDSTVVGRPASMPGVPFVWEVLPSDVSAAQDALHMHKSQMTGASQSLVRLAPVRWLYSGQQNGLSHAVVTYVLQGRALCP